MALFSGFRKSIPCEETFADHKSFQREGVTFGCFTHVDTLACPFGKKGKPDSVAKNPTEAVNTALASSNPKKEGLSNGIVFQKYC